MESGLSVAALHREGLLYVNTHGTVANLWGVCSETGLPTFASHVPLHPAPLWSLMSGVFVFFFSDNSGCPWTLFVDQANSQRSSCLHIPSAGRD